jgi:exodeoxyribonuclease-5
LEPLVQDFFESVSNFEQILKGSNFQEQETVEIVRHFRTLVNEFPKDTNLNDPGSIVRFVANAPDQSLLTDKGKFRAYQKQGKWKAAARAVGLAEADGKRMNDLATEAYERSRDTYLRLRENASSIALGLLIEEVRPVIDRFQNYKRSVARLDFDDLIFAARDLLRNHEGVRKLLGKKFTSVLVDEFQDTDPLQSEIFWRLCGDPTSQDKLYDWRQFTIRLGALFLVGDPKQAIYRFRGADVSAYVDARSALVEQDNQSVITISTNFRSQAPILEFVNSRFEGPLSSDQQPGFTSLDPFKDDNAGKLCVAALDVSLDISNGKAKADALRDAEADAVADLCARLIGSYQLKDEKSGNFRTCKPGDIALLAPSGSDLWRYESALEKYGIPVATQAGKGLYKRQEIQDLIALTAVLADSRDTLALGALLRGPLVGLTEEELLDIVWDQPRDPSDPDALPRLNLYIELEFIKNPYARDIFEKLRSLRKGANSTTPHALLSKAIDVLRVRPILNLRHGKQAERALSNVDLFLSFTRPYSGRGLRAFSEAMRQAWEDENRQAEGRPDAQEEAIALYTMHASKGLEWPIVIPINAATVIKAADSEVLNRADDRFYRPIFKITPTGYEEIKEQETNELKRERVRLWYVATTRAKELLIIPRANQDAVSNSWIKIVDLAVSDLPPIDLSAFCLEIPPRPEENQNIQTREVFASEAARIVDLSHPIVWLTPSKHDAADEHTNGEAAVISISNLDEETTDTVPLIEVKGSTKRGLIIHKLLEEVLTGETLENLDNLTSRAHELIISLNETHHDVAAEGISADEIASSCSLALNLPEIQELRLGNLRPEISIYASDLKGSLEQITSGFADAIAYKDGSPDVVIDWKSDVSPSANIIESYKGQIKAYLSAVGAKKGLLVFVTSGKTINVNL